MVGEGQYSRNTNLVLEDQFKAPAGLQKGGLYVHAPPSFHLGA